MFAKNVVTWQLSDTSCLVVVSMVVLQVGLVVTLYVGRSLQTFVSVGKFLHFPKSFIVTYYYVTSVWSAGFIHCYKSGQKILWIILKHFQTVASNREPYSFLFNWKQFGYPPRRNLRKSKFIYYDVLCSFLRDANSVCNLPDGQSPVCQYQITDFPDVFFSRRRRRPAGARVVFNTLPSAFKFCNPLFHSRIRRSRFPQCWWHIFVNLFWS